MKNQVIWCFCSRYVPKSKIIYLPLFIPDFINRIFANPDSSRCALFFINSAGASRPSTGNYKKRFCGRFLHLPPFTIVNATTLDPVDRVTIARNPWLVPHRRRDAIVLTSPSFSRALGRNPRGSRCSGRMQKHAGKPQTLGMLLSASVPRRSAGRGMRTHCSHLRVTCLDEDTLVAGSCADL